MQPTESDFDLLANRLADGLESDEVQLHELGASVFTTAKLIELKGRFQERLDQFDFWQGRLMKAAMWSPAFLLAGAVLIWFRVPRIGWLLLTMFPTLLIITLAGVFLVAQHFGGRRNLECYLEDIETELKGRQKVVTSSKKKF
ncbi:MAG: hypothetical protein H6577_11590 [Lewinellaceae bacterium]|nr:hypothetical protein [Saprospiraceae bacterium]MCB9338759.1 hypothetical protein [Lewinellaceae bacterium]